MLFCLVGYSSLVDEGEPIKEIGCSGGWSSAEDAVGIGIQNGILRVLLQRKPVRMEEMVLQRRPLIVEGIVFVG